MHSMGMKIEKKKPIKTVFETKICIYSPQNTQGC